ncbi:MAG: tetratricopeptide repeat protein [Oxalobacter sp.]
MKDKRLFCLILAGCCVWGLPALADDASIAEPPAVDETLLLPPPIEGQHHTIPDTRSSTVPIDTETKSSAMAQSKITTINILQELDKRAHAGDSECQFQLGYLYANGKGVRQDDQEAIYWYRQAALGGNAKGLVAMAEAFDLGRGVRQNAIAAYVLAKAAVAVKPEAVVVVAPLKAKLPEAGLAKAETMSVQEALKLK